MLKSKPALLVALTAFFCFAGLATASIDISGTSGSNGPNQWQSYTARECGSNATSTLSKLHSSSYNAVLEYMYVEGLSLAKDSESAVLITTSDAFDGRCWVATTTLWMTPCEGYKCT